jgi:hypothetical protein
MGRSCAGWAREEKVSGDNCHYGRPIFCLGKFRWRKAQRMSVTGTQRNCQRYRVASAFDHLADTSAVARTAAYVPFRARAPCEAGDGLCMGKLFG